MNTLFLLFDKLSFKLTSFDMNKFLYEDNDEYSKRYLKKYIPFEDKLELVMMILHTYKIFISPLNFDKNENECNHK